MISFKSTVGDSVSPKHPASGARKIIATIAKDLTDFDMMLPDCWPQHYLICLLIKCGKKPLQE
jgi:hypothetical protein